MTFFLNCLLKTATFYTWHKFEGTTFEELLQTDRHHRQLLYPSCQGLKIVLLSYLYTSACAGWAGKLIWEIRKAGWSRLPVPTRSILLLLYMPTFFYACWRMLGPVACVDKPAFLCMHPYFWMTLLPFSLYRTGVLGHAGRERHWLGSKRLHSSSCMSWATWSEQAYPVSNRAESYSITSSFC